MPNVDAAQQHQALQNNILQAIVRQQGEQNDLIANIQANNVPRRRQDQGDNVKSKISYKPESYNGSDEYPTAAIWLRKYDMYAEAKNIPEHEQLVEMPLYFKGTAELWYHALRLLRE